MTLKCSFFYCAVLVLSKQLFMEDNTLKSVYIGPIKLSLFLLPDISCTYYLYLCFISHLLYDVISVDYSCSYWKSTLPKQGWMYLSINHVCFYAFFMGSETKLVMKWSELTVSDVYHSN